MMPSTPGMAGTMARPRQYGAAARPSVRSQRTITCGLDLLDLVLAQQPAGPHHEHEHDESERDRVAKLGRLEPGDAVDDAKQQPTDDGAGEAGECTDDGRGELLERAVAQ